MAKLSARTRVRVSPTTRVYYTQWANENITQTSKIETLSISYLPANADDSRQRQAVSTISCRQAMSPIRTVICWGG